MNKDEKSSTRKNMQSFLRVPPKSQSMLHFNFYSIHNFNNGNLVFHLSDLIKKFAKSIPFNSTAIHDIVSTWTYLEKDEKLLETLFDVRCFDEISTLIFRNPGVWKFTKNQFETLIEEGELDLILYYVKLRECRLILDDYENQKKIVNKYIKYGNRMYYGAEMLSYINKNNWNLNFTSDLLRYIERTIKTKDILNCHSPVLTCLLLCEFINQIAESSVQYRLHCEKVVLDLCNFCNSIQEANPEEKYIKFLMTQKDTKGRSAYQISADHHYYSVLKTPEIGTIVQKMWNGRLSHDGLMSFSSVAKYVESNSSRSLNPFENFESFDHNKTYYHQLSLWTESSSLRYWPESVSTILLISVYNYFIYFLVYRTNSDQPIKKLMQPISDLEDKDLKFFAYFFIFWTFSIVMNIPLQFLFGNLSGRKYRMDLWGYIEILTLLSSLCLLIDTTQIFPPTDDYGNIVPSDGQSDKAFILRAIILSVNDVLVWLRVTGIFLTFKNLGPLIRMISLLSLKTLKYLVVYALYFTACASVFTAIFYDKSDQFVSFSMTFTSLFVSFLNNPNAFGFNQYQVYGAIAVIFFTTVSGLLLSNLLIAVLSNEYEVLSDVVDASHRSVLISYFRRYKWDNKYGYLIYLTTPLNIVNFLALPFSIFFKRKKFNKYVCRLYHSLFYLPIIMLLQCVFMIILTPFAYLKGLFMMNSHQFFNQKGNALSKLSGVLNWIIFGFPYILIMNIRDMILLLQTVFKKIAVMSYEKNRIQKYITKDDIRVFLQFVHSRENDEANDLHTLFLDYLNFDQEHKAENDRNMKEKSAYMKRLKSAAGINNNKKSTRQQPGLIMYNNKTSNRNSSSHLGDPEPPQKTSQNSMIKRNLIIIEILENFLIDDGSDNFIVDIDKLKMLLPKTMNINNGYIKRILNTDISSLSKAVNKIKTKKNKFMQNKLLNKIVGATIRLDYFVDNEDKFDPLHKEIDRKKHKFEVDENEDDFYTELYNLLNKISIDIKSSIETANMKKNKNKETIVGKNKELKDSELEREHDIGGEE